MPVLLQLINIWMYPFATLRRFLAVSISLILFLAIAFPLAAIHRDADRRSGCSNNQRQLWLAMQQYMADADGKFPRTTFAGRKSKGWDGDLRVPIAGYKGQPVGWVDALVPYYYSETLITCPSELNPPLYGKRRATHYTNYFMNANLSEKYARQLVKPEATVVFGDGGGDTDVSDATYAKNSIPAAWKTDPQSPAYRHRGGAIYLMADGTRHWLTPDEANHFGGRANAFAVR